MKWFRHDTDASTDAKLIKLRMRYGMEGYGLYWFCLEMIAGSLEAHNLTFELEHDSEVISYHTGIHQEKVEQIMKYMIDIKLFENDRGVITCLKMAKRLDSSMTSNPVFREMIKKIKTNPDVVMTESGLSHDGVMIESCKKEEKRKNNRGFTPPTPKEVQIYLDERGITEFTGEQFVNHYAATDWFRGKTKIKSWQHCVGTWNKSNKQKPEQAGDWI